ncbi:FAST kinase domain-containing protein 1, mitochondrial-like [Centruroides sculpturatus]|uniref:FAST kinase domain-containing protein 1, mitochondrial-like n=1 Tax=Centruroides sculpturatus TaxID=218467 RepID=UPI000C6E16BA|nr:FAST kinase domain-containing protein 1, mitochondrial-like [Centruroides sculpturatus]
MKKILSFINFKMSVKFKKEVLNHPKFTTLLSSINQQYHDIPINILPFVLLALRRIGIGINETVMQNLLNEAQRNYHLFSLQALSCCSVAIENLGHKNVTLMSLLVNHLADISKNITTGEELKCIAISIIHLKKLLSDSFIEEFAKKVEEIMKIETLSTGVIIKCLLALSISTNQHKYINTMQLLVDLLCDKISMMDISQLSIMPKLVKNGHCNFDNLSKVIRDRAVQLLQDDLSIHNQILILYCLSLFCKVEEKENIEKRLFDIFDSLPLEAYSSILADSVINLSVTNKNYLNKLWEKFADKIKLIKDPFKICQYYLLFRYKVMNYQHYKFEEIYSKFCKHYCDNPECLNTRKFSVSTAFLISCNEFKISQTVFNKLFEMSSQFSGHDILMLSIALHLNSYGNRNSIIIDDLKAKLNSVIISNLSNVTFNNLNKLISAEKLLYSDSNFLYTIAIEGCMNKYNFFKSKFTPKFVSYVSQNLAYSRYLLSDVINAMAKLILKSDHCFSFKAFSNFMHCCYTVGYCPEFEDFLDKSNELLLKYSENGENGLLILQSATALALFQHLKQELIHKIFSVSFMDKLDVEISAVHKMTPFKKEIHEVLCSVLSGSEYIEDHIYTPYYYRLDFECKLDKDKNPLPYSKQEIFKPKVYNQPFSTAHQRIAFNCLAEESFCVNMPQLCGNEIMKRRHLEILGYKIVEIPYFEWNSMKLSSKTAKSDYLYKKIFHS